MRITRQYFAINLSGQSRAAKFSARKGKKAPPPVARAAGTSCRGGGSFQFALTIQALTENV